MLNQILPLRGAIRHYDWGSRTALATLLGRPAPSPQPEAELWLGAHPHAPSEVGVDGRWERLDALLEKADDAELGTSESFRGRLPFLLKVLAVERPLSLQAHPDAEQARAGFRAERERVGRSGGPTRYADPDPKVELLCALTPFRALCGLRPLPELRARLASLGLGALVPEGDDERTVLAGFLRAWLADGARRDAMVHQAVAAAEAAADHDPVCACVTSLAEQHPGDPGVLAPLALNLVELAPGEALFVPPGELHCYLGGVAVELMSSSDNVLRGGLTRKTVDVDELLRVVSAAGRRPPVLKAEPCAPGVAVWRTPATEFELSLLTPAPDAPVTVAARAGIELLWCAEGAVEVATTAGQGLALARGESCVVPALVGPYRVSGRGRVFRAALPSPTTSRADGSHGARSSCGS